VETLRISFNGYHHCVITLTTSSPSKNTRKALAIGYLRKRNSKHGKNQAHPELSFGFMVFQDAGKQY
jgi:hypothetical protein